MAGNSINVNRGVQDPFYRYKMPRILAKVEGKGNGIKTVIANMNDIAKALSRPPTYPTKYFGCELGAQTNFDLKNERYIVNGEHDQNKLQDILDGFIKKFVLCPECENPETTLTVKGQKIQGKCKACGHRYTVDPKQKLSTFILKNPPPIENTEPEKDKPQENGSPAEEQNEREIAQIAENGKAEQESGSNEEEDDWAPEPVGDEQKLSGEMGKMVVDKDLDKEEDDRLDMLHQYFQQAKKDGSIQDGKKMLNEAERLELKTKAPLLLVLVLFDVNVVAQLKQFRNLLLRFCLDDKKAQGHLLGGIEQLVSKHKEVLLPKTAHIIKALYDCDICDEGVLLKWGSKPSKKYVDKQLVQEMIRMAQPVLKWLQEAEEESEEEDGVAVAFDDRSRAIGTTVVEETKKAGSGKENNKEEGKKAKENGQKVVEAKEAAEDIDIDNI